MNANSRERVLLLGCAALADPLSQAGFEPVPFEDARRLIRAAHKELGRACILSRDAVSLDELEEFVRKVRREMPFTDVVVWAPDASPDLVRRAFMAGACDVLLHDRPEPIIARVTEILDRQQYLPKLLVHREKMSQDWEFEGLLSRSRKMWDLFEVCVRSAATDATVLILGETGTGKELLARAFHRLSPRSGRFVALNCSAVQENLLDSELFGHVRGAFTGASHDKMGHFRNADGGTLFLDEIGDIPLQAQYRLLRVLQEGMVRPLGGEREIPVDVRVIAATSVPLDQAVADGTFREDLLYRLDVIRMVMPPLRERPEDILFLFGHFTTRLAREYNLPKPDVTDGFIEALQQYAWPGNVRQLENFSERLLLTRPNHTLAVEDFAYMVAPPSGAAENGSVLPADRDSLASLEPDTDEPLAATVDKAEAAWLRAALRRTGGRIDQTAAMAGINRRTLLRKLTRHRIRKEDFRKTESNPAGNGHTPH